LIYIGNDVVDLSDPRCQGRADDTRFLDRIFAPSEVGLVRDAADPNRTIWLLWAAKEVAFKVVSKIRGTPPPFAHAHFIVETGSDSQDDAGTVHFGDVAVAFEERPTESVVHLVGWGASDPATQSAAAPPPDRGPIGVVSDVRRVAEVLAGASSLDLTALRESRFSDRERGAIHSLPSAAVRIAARAGISDLLGVDPREVEIVCDGQVGRSPPKVWVGGEVSETDVSLSHHGDWIAWAALPSGMS